MTKDLIAKKPQFYINYEEFKFDGWREKGCFGCKFYINYEEFKLTLKTIIKTTITAFYINYEEFKCY